MKAITFEGAENYKVQERPRPALPKGGAIARISYASICGTDLRSYRFGSAKIAPGRIIGHEACYIIDEIDPAVSDFSVGDRVIVAPALGCGECRQCKKQKTNTCDHLETIGFEMDGTFAEYCAIPEKAFRQGGVFRVPAHVSDLQACLAEPVACAINGQSYLNIGDDDNVLIYGAGYLGCIHAELAKIQGAKTVTLAEISPARREQAIRDLNGINVIDSAAADFKEQLLALTNGEGVDVIITACPAAITHKVGLELINKLGRMSLFGGLPGDGKGYLDSNIIHYKEVSVYGVHASSPAHNKKALDYITNGDLHVEKYASTFAPEDVDTAMRGLIEEKVVKAVLKF